MLNQAKEGELRNYLAQQQDVEFAVLFGSLAQCRVNLFSDIDIGVCFKEGKDILALGQRQIELTCSVMRLCQMNNVDIVVLNTANPFLKFQVVKYGRMLYAHDEKVFFRFKASALAQYQDIKPMYDLYDTIAAISLRKGS